MRTTAAILALIVASCSSGPRRVGDPAPAAIAGTSVTVDDWHAVAVADGHLHPRAGGLEMLEAATGLMTTGFEILKTFEEDADNRDQLTRTVDCFCRTLTAMLRQMLGEPYGGHGRLTLGLRHYPDEKNAADRGFFIELPSLTPGEKERTVAAADMIAAYHDPVLEPKASVESGWVTVRRLEGDRAEFHIALIFRVAGKNERLHLVTRAETAIHRK